MSPRRRWFLAALLALAVLAAYRQLPANGFALSDDETLVTANARVRAGLSWSGLRWALTATEAANWHPLTWLSHMADVTLFGLDPAGHHATSLLLHLANALLLASLAASLTGSVPAGAAVAALFALHPLRVESVAWVAERKDLLAGTFWLLTTAAYRRYLARPSAARYAALLLVFLLGLASKPMLVTLPVVLLALDFWPLGRLGGPAAAARFAGRRGLRALALEKLPLALAAAVVVVATFVAQAGGEMLRDLTAYPVGVRLANAAVSSVAYLSQTLWPAGLHIPYRHPGATLGAPVVAGAAALLAALSTAAWLLRRRAPWLLSGWLWYLVALLPVSGIVQMSDQGRADRYTYLPLLGPVIALVWALGLAVRRSPRLRAAAAAALAVSLVILGTLTQRQVGHWRDSVSLLSHAAATDPKNHLAWMHLGSALSDAGRFSESLEAYETAIALRPELVLPRLNRAITLQILGSPERAGAAYLEALAVKGDHAPIRYNYGVFLASLGRTREAMAQFAEALRLDPGHAAASYNFGLLLAEQGRLDEAGRRFAAAIAADPRLAAAHNNLGIVLAAQGRSAAAVEEFRAALRLNPDDANARQNLERALAELGAGSAGR